MVATYLSRPMGPRPPQIIAPRDYNRSALIGNWYEERFEPVDGMAAAAKAVEEEKLAATLPPAESIARGSGFRAISAKNMQVFDSKRTIPDDGFRVHQTLNQTTYTDQTRPMPGRQFGSYDAGGPQPAPYPDTPFGPDDTGGPARKQKPRNRIVTLGNYRRIFSERPDLGAVRGLDEILPHHPPDYDTRHMETTQRYFQQTGLKGVPYNESFGYGTPVPGQHATYTFPNAPEGLNQAPPSFGRDVGCGESNYTVLPGGKKVALMSAATLNPARHTHFHRFARDQNPLRGTTDVGGATLGKGTEMLHPQPRSYTVSRVHKEESNKGGSRVWSDYTPKDKPWIAPDPFGVVDGPYSAYGHSARASARFGPASASAAQAPAAAPEPQGEEAAAAEQQQQQQ
eukprot:tig00020510_g9794.t1